MFKYIHDWLWEHIWRRRIVPKKYEMTGKGEYILQYILDKYINEVKPDEYIEAYENTLIGKIKEWREAGEIQTWFSKFDNIDKYTDEQLKYFAASNYFTILLSVTNPEKRPHYYEQINNEELRNMFKTIVEGR